MGYTGYKNVQLKNDNLLFPELSYQVVGVLFKVHNKLGDGLLEKYYQKAIAEFLTLENIPFKEQVEVQLIIGGKVTAKGYIDFLIDDKIVLEIKRGDRFNKKNIEQIYSYLKLIDKQLGILVNFTSIGVQFKRIVNVK